MDLGSVPFTCTDWETIDRTEVPGEEGTSWHRVQTFGDLRVRVVEYAPGFRSDHYCPRGHVLQVLEGRLDILLQDGTVHELTAGKGFIAGDDEENPHLAFTATGATVFIVD